ncbi:MAG: SEC-C domain-containing protein, partial [Clostridia bacterium]|nr:SEC-C domain-containing protein [Clostridia bacterium]
PEYMAKREMRKMEISEDLIAMATGTSDVDDEEILNARAVFKELYEQYKDEIAPEAEAVREAGGLFILGTERHESRRIDNQLRGRSGRQGDPGESRFFISFEDDLMRLFGAERMINIVNALRLPEDAPIDAKLLSNTIESAQRRIEDQNFKRRKYVLSYDDVMNQQRNIIYSQRNNVLNGEDISETITKMIESTIIENVSAFLGAEERENWDFVGLRENYKGLLTTSEDFEYDEKELKKVKIDDIANMLYDRAIEIYKSKEELFGAERFREIERAILLQNVDYNWMEHIDAMDDLKDTIRLQAYAQRDPINEYRLQGADMFDAMIADIRDRTVRMVLTVVPNVAEVERVQVAKPISEGFEGDTSKKPKKVVISKKNEDVGRNDLCPCGSGKKYKKCCGASANQ